MILDGCHEGERCERRRWREERAERLPPQRRASEQPPEGRLLASRSGSGRNFVSE